MMNPIRSGYTESGVQPVMKSYRFILGFTLTGIALCLGHARAESRPDISDDLKTAAAIAVGISKDDLGDAAIKSIRTLTLNHRGTVDLSGIDQFTGLEALELSGNTISDIGRLSKLKNLRYLDLQDNRIDNLAPLSGLTNLRYLDISENLVTTLGPLSDLKQLVALDADENAIEDLQALSAPTNLRYLRLASNRIEYLNPLASLTALRRLDVEQNHIPSLRPLASCTDLVRLDITNNRVAYLGALKDLSRLRVLRAGENPIVDIAPLADLQRLEVLRMTTTKFNGDLTPLAKLNGLRVLHFPRSDINNVAPLRNLMALREINLSHNQIENLGPLVRVMLDAESVDLRGNPLNVDSRARHLPALANKVQFDGVTISRINALFRQFTQLDRDQDGKLSYIETSILNPAITLEQFDALDTSHDLALVRAELYRFAKPQPDSLDVAWLTSTYTVFADGSKHAPFHKAEDAFAALKPNGTLMLGADVDLDVSKLKKPMKIVRIEEQETPKSETTTPQPKNAGETKPVRVVTPRLRSEYPDPAPE